METREQNMQRQEAAKARQAAAMERMAEASTEAEWKAAQAVMEQACRDEVQAVNDWNDASANTAYK